MLDLNALSQLKQLKSEIRADKNLTEGTVRGTQGRFGFVVLDDGREAFLAPEEMGRVFPGDRVEVSLSEAEGGKLNGTLDKLVKSGLNQCVGQYLIRGKGHFIAIDMPNLSRWVFIPPKARKNAKEHDFISARITRHPFEDGKGQAQITEVLGQPDQAGIEHRVTCLKYNLPTTWRSEQTAQIADVKANVEKLQRQLEDMTATPFVTIDSASTQDMDDAIFCEAVDDGWKLQVAIADPSSFIKPTSPLGIAAWQRGNTAYLPGNPITMIPPELANGLFSLIAGEDRPAWIFTIHMGVNGEVIDFNYQHGRIKVAHKLTYKGAAAFIDHDDSSQIPLESADLLQTLYSCSQARNRYRQQHMLLMEERDDFALILNEQQHIDHIERIQRNSAHQIVEEAMLVTNTCAGELFAQHPATGIYSAHAGFREERLDDIRKVLQEDFPELGSLDITQAEDYRQLIRSLHSTPSASSLLSAFRQMLRAGELTTEPRPHLGLGMQYYATVTSPIRRYNDYYNHLALAAIAENREIAVPSEEKLQELQANIGVTRQAARALEQWLIRLYMEPKIGEEFEASIFRINAQGLNIRLNDYGINGFVRLVSKENKLVFDAKRMTLTLQDNTCYQLDQPLQVKLVAINHDRNQINFELVSSIANNPLPEPNP